MTTQADAALSVRCLSSALKSNPRLSTLHYNYPLPPFSLTRTPHSLPYQLQVNLSCHRPAPAAMGNNNAKLLPAPPTARGEEVLAQLLQENHHYVHGRTRKLRNVKQRRDELSNGQAPVAAVIACADSRVAPEILFRAGLGELFVIRTAGNITWGPEVAGSLQYAVEHLNVPLVLVLGHSKCGAVGAACSGGDPLPGQLGELITSIAKGIDSAGGMTTELDVAVGRNVRSCVNHLTKDADSFVSRAQKRGTVVRGAIYDITTGRVNMLDDEMEPEEKCMVAPPMKELEPEEKAPTPLIVVKPEGPLSPTGVVEITV